MKRVLLILLIIITSILLIGAWYWHNREISALEMPDTYDTILKRGYVIAGVKTDTKPFGYIDENDNIVGLDIDLAKIIAKAIFRDESKIQLISVTPSDRLIKLTTGEVDFVVATLTVTPSRMDLVDFSHSYFIAGQTVMVPANSKVASLTDLANQNVGVIFGTTAEKNLRILLPTAKVFGYKTYKEAYEGLKDGTIQAITADDTILRNYTLNDKTVKVLNKRYSKEPYAIAVRKGDENKALLEKINLTLKTIINNNSISRLYAKWGLN